MSEFFELHYTGFHCIRQSTLDLTPWDDDEPYFLFTVSDGLDTSDPKRSPVYKKVRSGTTRRQPGEFPVWRTTDLSAERHTISLIATAFEEDWGKKSEAEAAFKNVVSAAVKAGLGGLAKGAAGGGLAGAAVGFGVGLVAKLTADLTAELFNFGDDRVGLSGVYLSHDDIRRLAKSKPNWFGDDPMPWHIVIRIKGKQEGTYFLFFVVKSHKEGDNRASLHRISAGRDFIRSRRVVANEDRFLTGGAARDGQMLLMSNYHDKAYTRDQPTDNRPEYYWRWYGGQQYSHIVPGRFSDRRSSSEYFMYRASDGRFSILMPGTSWLTNGHRVSEGDHTIIDGGSVLSEADIVVPGVFSAHAARTGTTDILLYRSSGRQEYVSFVRGGSGPDSNPVRIPDNYKNWSVGWDLIVPLDWPNRDRTSLMLYNRETARVQFWHTSREAQINLFSSHEFDKNWTFAAQVEMGFSQDEQVFILFYGRSSGSAQIWSFPNVKKHADVQIGDFEFLIPDRMGIRSGSVASHTIYGYRVTE